MSSEVAMEITCSDVKRVLSGCKQNIEGAEETLCKALDLIKLGGEFDTALISKLTVIAEQLDPKSIEWIAPIVCALTELYPVAQPIISELSKSQYVIGRLCAIYALSPKLSDEFVVTVLGPLISDRKSVKIRMAVVDWIGRHNKAPLSNMLETALSSERNENIRKLIVDELALLRFGYLVERDKDPAYITAVGSLGRISMVLENSDVQRLSDSEIFELYRPKLRLAALGDGIKDGGQV